MFHHYHQSESIIMIKALVLFSRWNRHYSEEQLTIAENSLDLVELAIFDEMEPYFFLASYFYVSHFQAAILHLYLDLGLEFIKVFSFTAFDHN